MKKVLEIGIDKGLTQVSRPNCLSILSEKGYQYIHSVSPFIATKIGFHHAPRFAHLISKDEN